MPSTPLPDDASTKETAISDGSLAALGKVLQFSHRSDNRAPWSPPSVEQLQATLPGYRVESFIAQGGMGAVYRGYQLSLKRTVAIKVLSPLLLETEAGYARRFEQEARAMAQLSHPGIVAVHDSGATTSGILYFVMEFVDGSDVAQMITAQGRLHSAEAMNIVAHVCDALHYAHRRGVVHRDIKPANIMVGRDGVIKVADFGLARMDHAERDALTRSGVLMGTPHYMAPETLKPDLKTDHRADIYAVGVMLYQMLTGSLPQGAFDAVSQQVPGLDPRWDEIITAALRTDREQRYQSIRDLRVALDRITTQPVIRQTAKPPPVLSSIARHVLKRHLWLSASLLVGLMAVLWMLRPRRGGIQPVKVAQDPARVLPAKNTEASMAKPYVNSLGMKFVPLPGTRTLMCIHETRRQDYAAYAAVEPGVDDWWSTSFRESEPVGHEDNHPVVNTSWFDAQSFCQWLSRKEGRRYRLPTDKEWSIAIGIDSLEDQSLSPEMKSRWNLDLFPWGLQWPPPPRVGNLNDAAHHDAFGIDPRPNYSDGYATTAPVMSFQPNDLGIYDLSGNVWEWCEDWLNSDQESRVLRGCHFGDIKLKYYAASARTSRPPHARLLCDGFRCVLETANEQPSVQRKLLDSHRASITKPVSAPVAALPASTPEPGQTVDFDFAMETHSGADAYIAWQQGSQERFIGRFLPGKVQLPASGLRDGEHWLTIRANGYATQRHRIMITDQVPSALGQVSLYHMRYVVIRAAFASSGRKSLSGPDLKEQRMALTHFASPAGLGRHEWEVQQQAKPGDGKEAQYSSEPYLSFNAFWQYYGFAPARAGETFDTMQLAPSEGYVPRPTKATKGLLLYFRTHGRNTSTDQGYGKLEVEGIFSSPPSGVPIPSARKL